MGGAAGAGLFKNFEGGMGMTLFISDCSQFMDKLTNITSGEDIDKIIEMTM